MTRVERAKAHIEQDEKNILCRGGRTGRKVHAARRGSTVTYCGHWMKHLAHHFQVSAARLDESWEPAICERCFPE